ncbi:MAG: hypothetical protein ACRDFB_05470 [Rhabdochlamydiaceae bacterium]
MAIPLAPNDRFALVGKTGSGKTSFATLLASTLVPVDKGDWQVWWLDTKGDPKDIVRLRDWGFMHVNSYKRDVPKHIKRHNRIYFPIRERDKGPSIIAQGQHIIGDALRRKKVLLVVDEYTHIVTNQRSPGKTLGNAFRTGRGLNVGLIGCTQEPVFVPRQLLSQAGHLFLFDVSYPTDIKYLQNLYSEYVRPLELGDVHGFHTKHIDGTSKWRYYTDQKTWYKEILPTVEKE